MPDTTRGDSCCWGGHSIVPYYPLCANCPRRDLVQSVVRRAKEISPGAWKATGREVDRHQSVMAAEQEFSL